MSYLFCLSKTVVFVVVQLLSCVWLFATSWTEALRLFSTVSQSLLKFRSIESVMPSNHFILCCSLFLLPSVFPSIRVFSNELALCIRCQMLELQLQQQTFQWIFRVDAMTVDWFVLCSPEFFQESSPAPQFKSIDSLALSLLYGPTLTSVDDYWKNHSFDYTDFCQQSDVSVF